MSLSRHDGVHGMYSYNEIVGFCLLDIQISRANLWEKALLWYSSRHETQIFPSRFGSGAAGHVATY